MYSKVHGTEQVLILKWDETETLVILGTLTEWNGITEQTKKTELNGLVSER